eukprot:463718_1
MAMNRTTINMVIILFTAITISNAQTQWTVVSDPPISSRNYYNKAIGYHNGSIFFLDVSEYHEFNLSNFVITNRGPLAPFVGGTPFGQFSAYIDDTIYWVLSGPYTDPVIGRYNMATNQLTTTWLTTTTTQPDPCLTATDTHLYVLGGYDPDKGIQKSGFNTVRSIEIQTQQWIGMGGAGSMKVARGRLGCVADANTQQVFAIGGWTISTNGIDTVEVLNIAGRKWTVLADTLYTGMEKAIGHVFNNTVYILGGLYAARSDRIHIIDPITNIMTLSPIRLPFAMSGQVPVVTPNNVYIFFQSNWLIYDIGPTSSPTMQLSNNPTKSPTTTSSSDPSNNPTSTPTEMTELPTLSPSRDPSTPTSNPSLNPTQMPSLYPSLNPSNNPTSTPTELPTLSPSRDPSTPTLNPSVTPTQMPSTPTSNPLLNPTSTPTELPTLSPSRDPSTPTLNPSVTPTQMPSTPTSNPLLNPTSTPTELPTLSPSRDPSSIPTTIPSRPSITPTKSPTNPPSSDPTNNPIKFPTISPSHDPSSEPSPFATRYPTVPTINAPYSNYTISILFDCEPEDVVHACDINKTTITRQVSAIIVAYIDPYYNTALLSTDIINDEVVIILSIQTDEYNSLIGEAIGDRIEK